MDNETTPQPQGQVFNIKAELKASGHRREDGKTSAQVEREIRWQKRRERFTKLWH